MANYENASIFAADRVMRALSSQGVTPVIVTPPDPWISTVLGVLVPRTPKNIHHSALHGLATVKSLTDPFVRTPSGGARVVTDTATGQRYEGDILTAGLVRQDGAISPVEARRLSHVQVMIVGAAFPGHRLRFGGRADGLVGAELTSPGAVSLVLEPLPQSGVDGTRPGDLPARPFDGGLALDDKLTNPSELPLDRHSSADARDYVSPIARDFDGSDLMTPGFRAALETAGIELPSRSGRTARVGTYPSRPRIEVAGRVESAASDGSQDPVATERRSTEPLQTDQSGRDLREPGRRDPHSSERFHGSRDRGDAPLRRTADVAGMDEVERTDTERPAQSEIAHPLEVRSTRVDAGQSPAERDLDISPRLR